MKNITLSLPDELLDQSRAYAQRHGTSLNELVRHLLRLQVHFQQDNPLDQFVRLTQEFSVDTKSIKWTRDELYDRKILS
jgi:plasmid stability protein